jgi:hypothetical protein
MIYLLTFGVSAALLYLAEDLKRAYKIAAIVFALIIPIAIATLRAETVGIDVYTYMKPLYNCSMYSSDLGSFFINLKKDPSLYTLDLGYAYLGYFASFITRGLWGIFLVNALLCILPVYFAVRKINKYLAMQNKGWRIPYWAAMFTYYCVFYNNSLNQVRQIIAVGLIFYCFASLINKQYIRSFLVFVFACTLHVSSVVYIYIIAIYYVTRYSSKVVYVLIALLAVFEIFGIQLFMLAMQLLNTMHLIPYKYLEQIFDMQYTERNLNLTWLVLALTMTGITALYHIFHRKDTFGRFMLIMAVTNLSLFNFSSLFISFGRMHLFFMIFATIAMCMPITKNWLKGYDLHPCLYDTRINVNAIVSFFVPLIFWLVSVGITDFTGTLNYVFAF